MLDLKSLANVTRVHVVQTGADHREYWADEWMVSYQDDGRTLKLFAIGDGKKGRSDRDSALTIDLVGLLGR